MQVYIFGVPKMCIGSQHKIIEVKEIFELTENQTCMCAQTLVKPVLKELPSFSAADYSYS